MIKLAKENGVSEKDIDRVLDSEKAQSRKCNGNVGTYRDLLDGKFTIIKIWHIGRQDDSDAIFGKLTDFSSQSITKLIEDGEKYGNRLCTL